MRRGDPARRDRSAPGRARTARLGRRTSGPSRTGTAAGTTSAAERAYYAHRQNKFWKILHETRLTPELLRPHQFRSLLQHRIGLTDLVIFPAMPGDSYARAKEQMTRFADSVLPLLPADTEVTP